MNDTKTLPFRGTNREKQALPVYKLNRETNIHRTYINTPIPYQEFFLSFESDVIR